MINMVQGRDLTGREVIDILVDHLNHGMESTDVWMIVSALRGPDSKDSQLKYLTTARLRAAIGLDYLTRFIADTANIPLDSDQISKRDALLAEGLAGSYHFETHYAWAANAVKRLFGYDLVTERGV